MMGGGSKQSPDHRYNETKIGGNQAVSTDNLYDVIIIGGGPAGLTAAIYLTRAKYRVLLLEKEKFGGQITISAEVVNYPGVGKCSGKELTDIMYAQAEYFGTEFLLAEATGLEVTGDVKTVHTTRGDYQSLGILIATGAHPKSVGFIGEEKYKGRGVAYCATCDGEFFTGKDVFVVGGGFAAAEESVFLTKFARHVTILVRGDDFSCAKAVADQARNHPKITVKTNTVVEEVAGEHGLNYMRCKNIKTGEITEFKTENGETFGVFVFAGYAPATELVKEIVELSEYGYIVTDLSKRTSVSGVYAAGDICIKPLRQVVTATGDGALAATDLEKYVAKMQEKTGLYPKDPVLKEADMGKQNDASDETEIFNSEMKAQLHTVFNKMENPLILKLYLDKRPLSQELLEYMKAFVSLTEKLTMEVVEENVSIKETPCVRIYRKDGSDTGLAFHGVPGGHECTSFVLGLYNASGPGQHLDEEIRKRMISIKPVDKQETDINSETGNNRKIDIKILVTLTCTMCPELVIAVQHIAALNPNVTAEIYDANHFEDLRNKYKVMSVPCMVINDEQVMFGKKNLLQVLEIIESLS